MSRRIATPYDFKVIDGERDQCPGYPVGICKLDLIGGGEVCTGIPGVIGHDGSACTRRKGVLRYGPQQSDHVVLLGSHGMTLEVFARKRRRVKSRAQTLRMAVATAPAIRAPEFTNCRAGSSAAPFCLPPRSGRGGPGAFHLKFIADDEVTGARPAPSPRIDRCVWAARREEGRNFATAQHAALQEAVLMHRICVELARRLVGFGRGIADRAPDNFKG